MARPRTRTNDLRGVTSAGNRRGALTPIIAAPPNRHRGTVRLREAPGDLFGPTPDGSPDELVLPAQPFLSEGEESDYAPHNAASDAEDSEGEGPVVTGEGGRSLQPPWTSQPTPTIPRPGYTSSSGTPSSPWTSEADLGAVGGIKRKRKARGEGMMGGYGGGKIRACDHAPAEQALLGDAKAIYWATLGAVNPYAEDDEKEDLIDQSLREAADTRRVQLVLRDTHRKYLRECTSKFRSRVVEAARMAVKAHFITPMITKHVTNGQCIHDPAFQATLGSEVRNLIDENLYIYQCPEARRLAYRSAAITEVITTAWFKDKESLAITVKRLYNPVPFPTIALAAAAVEFCLEEWKSGKQATQPWRTSEKWRYLDHMEGLQLFQQGQPAAVGRLQEWFYEQGCLHAGVAPKEDPKRRPRLTTASFANEEVADG